MLLNCFRQNHFRWCTIHETMVNVEQTICINNPQENTGAEIIRCRLVQCGIFPPSAFMKVDGESDE